MQIEMPAEQPNWFIVWRKLVNESFQRPGKNANICPTLLKFIFVIHGGGWKLLAIILPSCYFQCGHAGMRGIFVLSGNNCKFHCSTHTWPRPLSHKDAGPAPFQRRRKTFALSNCRQIAELCENLCQNVCHRHSGETF